MKTPHPFGLPVWRVISRSTVYLTTGGSVGATLAIVAAFWGRNDLAVWFTLGTFLPVGAIYLYFTSKNAMLREMNKYEAWYRAKRITRAQRDELTHLALRWYATTRFGKEEGVTLSNDNSIQVPGNDGLASIQESGDCRADIAS